MGERLIKERERELEGSTCIPTGILFFKDQ